MKTQSYTHIKIHAQAQIDMYGTWSYTLQQKDNIQKDTVCAPNLINCA